MNIRKIIQPLSYFIRGDFRYYYYSKLLKNLKLSREEVINLQNNKLRKLICHAYDSVPFYREYFKKKGLQPDDIKNISDLVHLPIMTKQIIKNNINKLKNIRYKRLIRVTSGGSTGEAAVIYKSPYFLQMSRAVSMRNFSIAGWLPWSKSVWIWAAPYEHQHISKSLIARLGMFINGRLFLDVFSYSPSDFSLWAEKIKLFKPEILYGYAHIILEFAVWCITNNVRFESIEKVVTTAETLTDKKTIERAFGVKVYDQYGSREVLSIAIECKNGSMHISDDTVVIEQTDENHLLITALDSFHFPIIRYEIGDTGVKLNRTCPCGLNFSLMDLKIGRISDNFILPNGRKICGFATKVSKLINMNKYQLIQKEIDSFELKFVGNMDEGIQMKFRQALEKYFGKVEIVFTPVENIPVEPSGKRFLFKCLVRNP